MTNTNPTQASPYSTGGGGTALEHRYGAVLMSHLLSGHPIDILGNDFTPTKISFQAPESPIDDYIVEGEHPRGFIRSVAIAVRRDPKLVESDLSSVKLIGSFAEFLNRHSASLLSGERRMALATSSDSAHGKQLRTLIEIAKGHPDNNAFRTAIARPGRTDSSVRNRLAALDKVVVKALDVMELGLTKEEAAAKTWSIISALHVHPLTLEGAASNDRTVAIAALQAIHPLGTAAAGDELFLKLSDLSASYAASAAVKGPLELQRDLGLRMRDGLWHRQRAWTDAVKTKVSARRRERRYAVGLSDAQVDASLSWDPAFPDELNNLKAGEVLQLSGPIGSGKSDTAERWLLKAANEFTSKGSFSIPVWLRAEDIIGSLEHAVRTELSNASPEVGVDLDISLVIDGMDERTTGAESLALESKVFTAAHPRSRILLTGRGGAISRSVSAVPIPELTLEEAEGIIARISGWDRVYTYNWPESLRESIKRPLFAMLAGSQIGDENLGTPAALIRAAAEHGSNETVDTEVLQKLAVALTWAGKAVDPLIALPGTSRAALTSSRLVIFEGARCRFALPVFEQWFAAQALLAGLVHLDEITANLLSFAKWRYVLAACLSSGTRESTDPIMMRIAAWNPGAIGWLVKESLPASLGSAQGAEVDEWRIEAQRVWEATKSLTDGLGATARLVRPTSAVDSTVPNPFNYLSLNFQTRERRIGQNWRFKTAERPQFTNERVNWFPPYGGDLITSKEGAPINQENWLWRWVFNDLAGDLSRSLGSKDLRQHLPKNGVVAREHMAWIFREVGKGLPARSASTRDELRVALSSALKSTNENGDPERTSYRFGNGAVLSFSEVCLANDGINATEVSVGDIWPTEDLSRGGWVWSGYSKAQMLRRVTEVYAGAMRAYEEIRQTLFESFGLTLGHAALFPANIEGHLRYNPVDQSLDGSPVLSYSLRPLSMPHQSGYGSANISYREERAGWGAVEEDLRELEKHISTNPEAAIFGQASRVQTALDIFHLRPATYIALDWLWSDLEALGWASGRRPDHH